MSPELSGAVAVVVAIGAVLGARRLLRRKKVRKPALAIARSQSLAACKGKRIGILVVAYNAVTTLSATLKRIPKEVWENIEEVAVFDDASKDETFELAVGYKTLFGVEKLTVLRNEKNLGYGGNQMRGYKYFMDRGFDVVVMLHGDGQYAPEVLADLYAPIVAGEADAVFGSRMMPDYGGPRAGGMPLYKFVGNKILTGYANYFLGMNLTEFHSGYRAYSLHALRRIDFSKMTQDFHFDTQIIIKFHHHGLRINEVAIPTFYGNEICYVNGMKYAKDVYFAVQRYRATLAGSRTAAEYAEFAPHESRNATGAIFRQLVGPGQEVLDVGEGHAPADLDRGLNDADRTLGNRTFDVIVLQGVLEHLRNPERVLEDCRARLRPHGRVAVSVTNVANVTVRLGLLFGRFEYRSGTAGRTRVQFFTRKTARELLEACGYEVTEQRDTVMPFAPGSRNPPAAVLRRALAVAAWLAPGLFGDQTVLIARPKVRPIPAGVVEPRVYRPAA